MNRLIDILFNINVLLSFSFIIVSIMLFMLYNRFIINKKKKLKIITIIPLIAGIIHFILFYFHGSIDFTFYFFKTIYITSIFIFITGFFLKHKKTFIILNTISLIVTILNLFIIAFISTSNYSIHNFSYLNYTDGFVKLMNTLKNEYPLNDWKNINYNSLEEKYFPLIQKAEQNNEKSLYYSTIFEFMNEFKDGHISVACNTDECWQELSEKYESTYYGFETVKVDNGDIVAVMVDEKSEAYQKGLKNGYKIIKRDGKDINDLLSEYYLKVYSIAVKSNEELHASTKLFHHGKNETEVTFIDDENNENTIKVNSCEYNLDYYNDISSYLLYADEKSDNFSTKMLDKDVGYININSVSYNHILDMLTYLTDNARHVKKHLISKLDDLKEKGMKKLIIDLRFNPGGLVHLSSEIASPFLNNSYTYAKAKSKITGNYDYYKIKGTGEYADIPVIVLVNDNTASAADSLTYLLSENDNIKIMGFMPSNNSCQEIGGEIFLKDGIRIAYPIFKTEIPDGSIYIDTDSSGIERIDLDVKVPITKENIMEIIDYNGDYVLDYAIKYLNGY